jgi:hypothetical protein
VPYSRPPAKRPSKPPSAATLGFGGHVDGRRQR